MKYSIKNNEDVIDVSIYRLIDNQEIKLSILKPVNLPNSWSVLFFTATTDMRDFIGNVEDVKDNKCSVNGVYRGNMLTLKNIDVKDSSIKKNKRVMVTEHINIHGRLEFIATSRRVLDISNPNINFINVGWSNNERCEYSRIDVYTGDVKTIIGRPVNKC